jgi:hypothetical protein
MDLKMADGRMLKKAISTSRKLAELKTDSARLLYTWILPHTDIEGRFSANPDIIKGYIVPRIKTMTPRKIESYLQDLAENDLIHLYRDNGDEFLEIIKFKDFQTLRKDRESPSRIPAPTKPKSTPAVLPEQSDTRQDKIKEVKLNKNKQSSKKGLNFATYDASFIFDWLNTDIGFISDFEKNTFRKYSRLTAGHPDKDKILRHITETILDCKEQIKLGTIQRSNMVKIISNEFKRTLT